MSNQISTSFSGVFAMDDTFYLYCALGSGMGFLLSSDPLTKYRLHHKNESFHSDARRTNVAERGSALSSRYLSQLDAFQVVIERRGWKGAALSLSLDRLYLGLVHRIQDSRTARGDVGRILCRMLSRPFDAVTWKWVVVESAAIGYMLSPRIVRLLYSKL